MELQTQAPIKTKFKKKEPKFVSIYSRCLITRHITLPMTAIGKNLRQTIEKYIQSTMEGKCLVEGFVKHNSTKIVTHSSGLIQGLTIQFMVVIECEVCFPVEGMLVSCVAKNITKAGIRAESANETPSPIVVFVARDHHYQAAQFSSIQEDDKFMARVIGQRFELNDKYISIIAELVMEKEKEKEAPKKPKLVFED